MTAELARRCDVPVALGDQMELAKALAASQLLPAHLRGKPENVLALQYAAQAIDMPLWPAMQEGQVINGKVGWSANLTRALAQRAGHKVRTVESSDETATVVVVRRDDPGYEHRVTFTLGDAKRAGLLTNQSWQKYPRAMLVARATTAVLREACADVMAGFAYAPEELGAVVDEEGRIAEPVPESSVPAAAEPAPHPQQGPGVPAAGTDLDPVVVAKQAVLHAGLRAGIHGAAALTVDYARRNGGAVLTDATADELTAYAAELADEARQAGGSV